MGETESVASKCQSIAKQHIFVLKHAIYRHTATDGLWLNTVNVIWYRAWLHWTKPGSNKDGWTSPKPNSTSHFIDHSFHKLHGLLPVVDEGLFFCSSLTWRYVCGGSGLLQLLTSLKQSQKLEWSLTFMKDRCSEKNDISRTSGIAVIYKTLKCVF